MQFDAGGAKIGIVDGAYPVGLRQRILADEKEGCASCRVLNLIAVKRDGSAWRA